MTHSGSASANTALSYYDDQSAQFSKLLQQAFRESPNGLSHLASREQQRLAKQSVTALRKDFEEGESHALLQLLNRNQTLAQGEHNQYFFQALRHAACEFLKPLIADHPDIGFMALEQLNNLIARAETQSITQQLVESQRIHDQLSRDFDSQKVEAQTFYALSENMPDGIAVVSLEATMRYGNPAFHKMLGYDDLTNMHVGEFFSDVDPDGNPSLSPEFVIMQALEHDTWQGLVTYKRVDGTLFLGNLSVCVIRDSQRNPIVFAGIVRDITQELRQEQERRQLQEQVILSQEALLRELSTPIIPLANDILVMPLVGSIDSNRAQMVLESLLDSVSKSRSSVVILDITGVPIVDTHVANALVRASQAIKLLGAQLILTGIRPEVAQTIVGLSLDLRNIVTQATLQNGIDYALSSRKSR
jgi:PAS domain S-box-containing protein